MASLDAVASPPAGLEPRFYQDPEVLALEDERIFSRTWQFVAHVAQLSEPGRYLTASAGSQPVLVLRDPEGELRAFRNVCRHRGSQLLSGSGECGKAIRCRYHGWTYRLEGDLIGVPEARSIPGLDKSALGLFPVAVEEMCGLIFVNLDADATPLAEQVAGLPERLARYRFEELTPKVEDLSGQPANWKVVVDNYLEGYHVPIAHPGLMRLLDYKNYGVELHDNWAWFNVPLRDKPSGNRLERIYQRMVEPMPGLGERGRARLALHPDLPEHHHRPLPGPDRHLADQPRRDREHQRPGPHPAAQGRGTPLAGRALRQPQDQRAGERRGRGPGARSPERHPHARLDPGTALRARGRGGLVRRQDPRRPSLMLA